MFNGGFETEHGEHGMFVHPVTLVPAKRGLCTIVGFEDGQVRIGTWETGFLVGTDDFVRKPSARDFFYLLTTRQEAYR